MRIELGHTRKKHWEKGCLYITPTVRFRWEEDKLIEVMWLFLRMSFVW